MNQPEPNPEKVGHVIGEVAKLLQETQCNPMEMALVALYTLQIMMQFGRDHREDFPKSMTIQAGDLTRADEITYSIKPCKMDPMKVNGSILPTLLG